MTKKKQDEAEKRQNVEEVEYKENKETRPESEYGLYGNTKPVSSTKVENYETLKTESTEDGDLSLLRNRDKKEN